jgi:DNA primase
MTPLLDLIQEDGFTLEKKTANEQAGPCFFCGGNDRLIVFVGEDRYWCRGCGAKGDAIDYLMQVRKMSFPDAARQVGKEIAPSSGRAVVTHAPKAPAPKKEQSELWKEKSVKFVCYGQARLAESPDVQNWLRIERGITKETAERFSLGWNPEDAYRKKNDWGLPDNGKKLYFPSGLIFPLTNAVKIRRDNPGEFARYYLVPGSAAEPFEIGTQHETTAVVVESELDAILLAQEIKRDLFIIAMGSCSNKPNDALMAKLEQCPVILVCMDTDQAGGKGAHWWFDNVSSTHRAIVPKRFGKDITEAFLNGLDLNAWLSASMKIVSKKVIAEAGQQFPDSVPF